MVKSKKFLNLGKKFLNFKKAGFFLPSKTFQNLKFKG